MTVIDRNPDPFDATRRQDAAKAVLAVLLKMPERDMRIFVMRHYGGKTLEQIGMLEGLSRERIKQLCDRGMNHLKKGIEPQKYIL